MQVDTLHPSWCLTKPLLSLAIGHLLDEGQLSLATTVRSLGLSIPLAVQESVTVGDLLNHSAGLRHPLMIGWRITPEGKRPSLLRAADNRAVPRIVYSEIAAGLVVEEIVAQLTGIDAAIFVRRRILEPLGLETEILIDRATACDPRIMARLRVPVSTTLENRSVATLEK